MKDNRPGNTGIVLMVLLLVLSACSPEKPKSDPRQEQMESMLAILAQVQKNLGRIQQKEAVVERLSTGVENRQSSNVEQIGKDINASLRFIDSTLAASKSLIQKLEEENRSSAYKVASLDRLVSEMKAAVSSKDGEVLTMKSQVQKLSRQVSSLRSTVDVLDEYIQGNESQLYNAYYIVGTFDELVSRGVLVKGSPLEKIFGTEYRLAPDFNIRQFNRIDITETRDLFFSHSLKNMKIITPHTAGSYELVGGKTSSILLIRDENLFWQKSRCLVIVVE